MIQLNIKKDFIWIIDFSFDLQLHHVFYFDGDANSISWRIQTKDSTVKQKRMHTKIYQNKITNIQSKYVALHVGLFWGTGVFIIKNKDSVEIMLDNKIIYGQFKGHTKIEDEFILKKMMFIKQLITQRELKIEFKLISTDKNLSREMLS